MSSETMEIEIKPLNVVNQQNPNNNQGGGQQMYRKAKKKFGRTYINILHDPRVVRGNTYAAFVIPSSLQQEFIRLKENEERQRRMMLVPRKLPRVALMPAKKLNITTEIDEEPDESKQVESPKYKELEELSTVEEDLPYYYIDKPPTPKYIPLPPGVEVDTQIEDGELFDFDLEVKPILEVLVGRSLVQARYELIEEDERNEYIKHKVEYEQEREFELNNLQRMEASRIRRVNEQNRRENQDVQRQKLSVVIQKKLFSKVFAKQHLANLKNRTLSHLDQLGYLKHSQEFNILKLQVFRNYPETFNIVGKFEGATLLLTKLLDDQYKSKYGNFNKIIIDKEKERVLKSKQDKELAIKQHLEDEESKHQARMKRKEEIRIERLTKKINDTIIKTKMTKNDILSLNLPVQIDEFKKKSDLIHSLGGFFGELTIILNEFPLVQNYLKNNNPSEEESKNIEKFFFFALEQTLLLLKEHQNLELTYIENIKTDLGNMDEAKRQENMDFLCDYRRFCSKSLKLLIDNNLVMKKVYDLLMKTIAELYYEIKVDPNTIVPDPENTDPDYLNSIAKQQQDIIQRNNHVDKLKAKIKINFEKVENEKANRNNYAAVIYVHPVKQTDVYNEEEEHLIENPPVVEEVKPENNNASSLIDPNLNLSNNNNSGGPGSEGMSGEKKSEDDKKEKAEEEGKQEEGPTETFSNINFVNSADVFNNKDANLDVYIIHEGVTDIYKIKILRKLKKFFEINQKFKLDEQVQSTRSKYSQYSDFVLNHILKNENYKNDKIFKIDVIPPEPEKEEDPNAQKM